LRLNLHFWSLLELREYLCNMFSIRFWASVVLKEEKDSCFAIIAISKWASKRMNKRRHLLSVSCKNEEGKENKIWQDLLWKIEKFFSKHADRD
jgi:hypothetical protein